MMEREEDAAAAAAAAAAAHTHTHTIKSQNNFIAHDLTQTGVTSNN